jgi:CheY-like chemotaxis protein
MAHVLVVEDEELMRSVIVAALSHAGHRVTQAADGHEAVKQFRGDPSDLIITDILMPESDGLDVLIALAREKKKVPVIVMSGIPGESALYLRAAKDLGAVRTLEKPFTMDVLLAVTKDVLHEHTPRRKKRT